MAIYTRFGSKILSVEWFDDDNGEIGCVIETEGGNPRARVFHSSDLKADDGIREIWDSARVIRNPRNPGTDPARHPSTRRASMSDDVLDAARQDELRTCTRHLRGEVAFGVIQRIYRQKGTGPILAKVQWEDEVTYDPLRALVILDEPWPVVVKPTKAKQHDRKH